MTERRITDHPVLGKMQERKAITFQFDGKNYEAYEGDTIASALLAHNIRTLRQHEETNRPRGIYCNIGHCYECRVTVNNKTNMRACLTPVQEGMVVESGQVLDSPLSPDQKEAIPRTYEEYEAWKAKKEQAK